MRRLPSTNPSNRASRRYFLQSIGALGLAGVFRPTQSDSAVGADFCTTGDGKATTLFIPGDSGYLGRLALHGKPLTLIASAVGALPPGIVHGPIAYRAQHKGRDYINPTLVVRRGERVQIELVNRLDNPTIAHWHGLAVDTHNDGAGMNLVAPGESYAYDFAATDRGALYCDRARWWTFARAGLCRTGFCCDSGAPLYSCGFARCAGRRDVGARIACIRSDAYRDDGRDGNRTRRTRSWQRVA